MRWLREWWLLLLVPASSFIFLYWVVSVSHLAAISVPTKFCKEQYTGRTKAEDVAIQTCAAYNQNMTCTAPITTWSTVTRNEARVTCEFMKWR